MEEIVSGVRFIAGILKPFFYGGVIAFILNIPMNALEKKLFQKRKGKYADKLRRPISLFLSILIIMLILSVIVGIVIPQLTSSIAEIGRKIPAFMQRLEEMEIVEIPWKMEIAEIPWESVIEKITQFLKNGAGDMLSSTFNMVGSIISAVADILIAFVFAIYILAQKEKLMNQLHRILTAYCSKKIVKTVEKVCSLLNMNFRNFITGQCLEAVILGTLFVIFMSILRLPYALVIGVLITLTALIPIVGAFIGCAVGVFLILIESPVQAVIFLILFFVLQQIEGKLIYPKVVGNFVGLPGIWVLFAITVGGSLFGVIGMLVFIPLFSTIYSLLRDDVNRRNSRLS